MSDRDALERMRSAEEDDGEACLDDAEEDDHGQNQDQEDSA